jgi:predicted nucleic acid-binding protein
LIVVDASVMAYVLAGEGAQKAAARAALAADEHWAAPEHWKVEVVSSVRGMLLGGKVTESRARQAIDTLGQLSVVPVSINDLLERIWELRHNVSAYDAAYVAAAELRDATLLTMDARLARAGGLKCPVRVV